MLIASSITHLTQSIGFFALIRLYLSNQLTFNELIHSTQLYQTLPSALQVKARCPLLAPPLDLAVDLLPFLGSIGTFLGDLVLVDGWTPQTVRRSTNA